MHMVRRSVRVPNTAVYAAGTRQNTAGYAARTRPCKYRIHGRARTVYRVHGRLHGRLYGPCARPCTYHVHGTWPEHGCVHGYVPYTRPCLRPVYSTRPVNGRVLPMDTAVFTARVRGRVPCTYTCLRPVYTAVHGRIQTAYGPCTWSVHDSNAAAAPTRRVYSPCRVHGRSRHVRTVYTTTQCIPGIAKVDNRNLLDGYYANNSFSGKRVGYIFGSRDLLGHSVGHVIVHAQLTLWAILLAETVPLKSVTDKETNKKTSKFSPPAAYKVRAPSYLAWW